MEPKQKIETNWLNDPRLVRLFQALKSGGGTPRLVGGVVRDTVLGRPQDDFDIAINQSPDVVMKSLKSSKISVIPTGIQHGTITAVVDSHPYQITSLRTDLKTDGRWAEVAFTQDWVLDASRRDFTINALYADLDGTIYDPFDGLEDLKQNCVRFIGDPLKRIEEDYLRILRFFRFSASYAQGELHPASLMACVRLAPQIQNLAKERITQEFFKLIKAPYAIPILKVMNESGILKEFLPADIDMESLEKIVNLEKHICLDPHPLLRLAGGSVSPNIVLSAFRLSNDEKYRYKKMFQQEAVTSNSIDKLFYLQGPQTVFDWMCLQGIDDQMLIEKVRNYSRPLFPLNGQDLIQRNLTGPAVGQYLKKVESWWIDSGFQRTREDCLAYLDQLLEINGS